MAAKNIGTVPGMDEMPEKLRAAKEDLKNTPSEFMQDLKSNFTPSGLEAKVKASIEREERAKVKERTTPEAKKKGGKVCGMKSGGKVRGCGCAERGLTKGKMR
jgi:hypothetical protein